MGAWGTSLYANDAASDIRGDYVDKLRRGKTNEEATRELIEKNREIMGDVEEEPLFWYALADTQWNYGRLLPEVKEKALYFLSQKGELERWAESGEAKLKAWMNTLEKLRQELLSPPPAEKRVPKYRFYKCKWNLGDVYAYRFSSEYSKEKGFYGDYIAFRKVSEDNLWPGHIVPMVQVYKWIGKDIPTLDFLKALPLLELTYYPKEYIHKLDTEKDYIISLAYSSERTIPKAKLTFLGNIPGDDLVPFSKRDYWVGHRYVGWEGTSWNNQFEHYMIDMYLAWKDY